MSLREEMWKYEQITGESAEHVPIIKLGAFLDGYEMGVKALEQTRWIPVSERLPEDEQRCLIAYKGMRESHIKIATYSTNLCKVNKYDFYNKKDISGFYGFDGEYGYYEWNDVIAWMPLPEPYKEDDSE